MIFFLSILSFLYNFRKFNDVLLIFLQHLFFNPFIFNILLCNWLNEFYLNQSPTIVHRNPKLRFHCLTTGNFSKDELSLPSIPRSVTKKNENSIKFSMVDTLTRRLANVSLKAP